MQHMALTFIFTLLFSSFLFIATACAASKTEETATVEITLTVQNAIQVGEDGKCHQNTGITECPRLERSRTSQDQKSHRQHIREWRKIRE